MRAFADCEKFAVFERPCCVWGAEPREHNIRFLRGLNTGFFTRFAQAHDAVEERESQEHAAIALRIAYGLGLESLFALLGAAVQAPQCAYGWLEAYTNQELRKVVRGIQTGELRYAAPPFRPVSWDRISAVVHAPLLEQDPARGEEAVRFFSAWWTRLAHEFVSEDASEEYNALKHGFRTMPGGFTVRAQPVDGEAFFEAAIPTGQTYFTLEKVAEAKHHYCIRHHTATLHAPRFQVGLLVVSQSMNNVAGCLRRLHGDQGDISFKVVNDPERLERVWSEGPPIARLNFGGGFVPDAEYRWSAAEILSAYDESDATD